MSYISAKDLADIYVIIRISELSLSWQYSPDLSYMYLCNYVLIIIVKCKKGQINDFLSSEFSDDH